MRNLALAIALSLTLGIAMALLATQKVAWAQMAALMGCVVWTGKALVIARHARAIGRPSLGRCLAFVLLWPGMKARRYLRPHVRPPTPRTDAWLEGAAHIAAGVGLIALATALHTHVATDLAADVAGWMALVGLAYVVFFGLFEVASLTHRSLGVDARPLFLTPRRSRNLVEFWGTRWNRGVHDLILDTAYAPLKRRTPVLATPAAFLMSGVLHEIVLSIPARGGYGLPTLYFVIQAVGVTLVGSRLGARWGLRDGARGWWFAACTTVGPIALLFPAPFHANVMAPMLSDLSGLA